MRLIKIWVVFLGLLMFFSVSRAQNVCQSGAIYVTGPGCGCLANCDLTSYGGPNCGSGTSGTCDGGYKHMSIQINVPSGCVVQATAVMQKWPNCSASGADAGGSCGAGCTGSCDKLRIVTTANPSKPWQCDSANATISDVETVTGPDVITIEGYANRKDEIIQFTVNYVSGGSACGASCGALPLNVWFLDGSYYNGDLYVTWAFNDEKNISYYEISVSPDGESFQELARVTTDKSIDGRYVYELKNLNIPEVYVKLRKVHQNGTFEDAPGWLHFKIEEYYDLPNPVKVLSSHRLMNGIESVEIFDLSGKKMVHNLSIEEGHSITAPDKPGIYIVLLKHDTGKTSRIKWVVTP